MENNGSHVKQALCCKHIVHRWLTMGAAGRGPRVQTALSTSGSSSELPMSMTVPTPAPLALGHGGLSASASHGTVSWAASSLLEEGYPNCSAYLSSLDVARPSVSSSCLQLEPCEPCRTRSALSSLSVRQCDRGARRASRLQGV